MTSRFAVLSLCLALVSATPNGLSQGIEQRNQSWDSLRQVAVGENLGIEKRDGKKSSGRFISYSDTELVFQRGDRNETVNRDDVRNLWSIAPPSRTKKAIFGGLGAAAGVIGGVGIAVSLSLRDCGGSCAGEKAGVIAALVGLPAAGLVGGLALAGKGKRTLIYSAP